MQPTRHVAFYGSRQQEGHIPAITQLIGRLLEAGVKVSVEKKLASVISEGGFRLHVHGVKECSRFPEDADLAVSVGGDGTFLRTARWLGGKEIPILGINTGHLGFLAENTTGHADTVADLVLSSDYTLERRLVLQVDYDPQPAAPGTPKSGEAFALNEVAFMKGAASMIDIDVKLDDFHLSTYRADGLLVATPTGSTAYNLSVGGPILAPTLSNIVLSPVAPHTLTQRPIVVSADSIIEATVFSRVHDFRLSIDGSPVTLPCGSMVRIKKAPHSVLTIRRPGENFASTLRSKLLWGH